MLKKWIMEYILKNKYDIFVILVMLVIGATIGIGIYTFSDTDMKKNLIDMSTKVFEISKSKEYLETNVILNGLKTNVILIAILAISSVTLFGRYMIEMLAIIKGAMLSIYTIILFNVFGLGYGILIVLLLVILVNMIYIPTYIFLSVMFMEIHFNIFKTKMGNLGVTKTVGIISKVVICYILLFSSVVVEQIASLMALKLFLKIS